MYCRVHNIKKSINIVILNTTGYDIKITLLSLIRLYIVGIALTFSIDIFSQLSTTNITNAPNHKLTLWYTTPAKQWSAEALPIGNAYLGGMVFGGIEKEQIQYNEKTLWSGGPGAWPDYNGGNNDSAALYLPAIRSIIKAGNYREAEVLMAKHMLGNSKAYGAYQTFGNMYFDFSSSIKADSVTAYHRELDMEDGMVRVKFSYKRVTYTREYFCSYPDRVMVMRFTCDKASNLTFDIWVDCAQSENTIIADATNKTIVTTGKVSDNKMGFESQIKISNEGGAITAEGNKLHVSRANSATVIMTAATEYVNIHPKYTGANPHDTVANVIKKACAMSYEKLLSNHKNDYQNLFKRVSLNFDKNVPDIPTNELKEKYVTSKNLFFQTLMFQYGRYLLIASSRTGTLPANLQGVWNNSNNPPWTCDYHFDVNIQMNYFAPEVTNLTECSIPLVDYINSLREPGRITAEKHHGIKGGGWVVHPMNNPFGFTAPGWETYWAWAPFNASWICQNLWDKYKFTGDTIYLRQYIYPIMKEQAQFWIKWLVPDLNGYLVSCPSVSPEHLPITDGPTSDQASCYELFNDVIEASQILNTDTDLRAELIVKRDKLLPLKIGKWGQLQEWKNDLDSRDDNHRHVSHLVTIYQGERINPYTTPKLFDAAKVSLQARDLAKGDMHGWSLTQRMGIWARLLEPEKAYTHLNTLLTDYITNNLFTLSGGVFQIEANLALPGMMAEMMIQSHLGFIHLLPAMPAAWSKGQVAGLCARGGFVIDMKWDKALLTEVVIVSKLGNPCIIKNPVFNNKFTLIDVNSAKKVKYKKNNDTIVFTTKKNGKYLIEFI